MPITTDIDTFANNYHKNNGCPECPVCFDIIREGKGVMCPNKHHCCEKHFISRAKSMYEEGNMAFQNKETTSQRCFMCRCDMPDMLFSNNYLKLLTLTQCFALGNLSGKTKKQCHAIWVNIHNHPGMEHLNK